MWSISRGFVFWIGVIVVAGGTAAHTVAQAGPRIKKTALCSGYLVAVAEAQARAAAGSISVDRGIQNLMEFRSRVKLPLVERKNVVDGVLGMDLMLNSRQDYAPERELVSKQIYGIWQDRQIARRRDSIQVFQALEWRGRDQIQTFLGGMSELHRQFGALGLGDPLVVDKNLSERKQALIAREKSARTRNALAYFGAPWGALVTGSAAAYFGVQTQNYFLADDGLGAAAGILSLGFGAATAFLVRAFAMAEANYLWGADRDARQTAAFLEGKLDWYYHSVGIEIDSETIQILNSQDLTRENLLALKNALAELELKTLSEKKAQRTASDLKNGISLRIDRLFWTEPTAEQKPVLTLIVRLAEDLPYQSNGGRTVKSPGWSALENLSPLLDGAR